MPFDFNLPPPSQAETAKQWEVYLNQQPVVTSDLMRFRYGYLSRTPLESSRNLMNTQYQRVPVPHPQQNGYSRVEGAKRAREEAIRLARQNQRVRIRGVEQRAPWIPPQEHPDLLRFRPNINHFTKSLRFHIPKGVF